MWLFFFFFSVIQKAKKKKHYLKIWSDLAEPGSILLASAERFRHALKYTLTLKVKEKYPRQLEAGTGLFLEHRAPLASFYRMAKNCLCAFKKIKLVFSFSKNSFHLTNVSFSPFFFSVLLPVLQRLLEQIVTCDGLLSSLYLQTESVTLFQFYSYLEKHHITSLEKHLGKLAKEGNGCTWLLRSPQSAALAVACQVTAQDVL